MYNYQKYTIEFSPLAQNLALFYCNSPASLSTYSNSL